MPRTLRNLLSILATLVPLGLASNASALTLTGGPVYALPGGGSCAVAGVASQTGGATLTCTGVSVAAHTHVYFGIRNNLNVNGNTMTGTAVSATSGTEMVMARPEPSARKSMSKPRRTSKAPLSQTVSTPG